MTEINRNQILEIILHQDLICLSPNANWPEHIPGRKHLEIIFMDEMYAHSEVVFKGVNFLVQSATAPVPGQINWTYSAVSTGDCSPLGELLEMARPANVITKDGKINMEKEYPTTTPITDIKEIKKALASIGPNGAFFDSAIDKDGAEIKLGDTIIITAKKFLHAYPIGTVCKVQGIYTNEKPYEWHNDGKNLMPDYNVKINAWNDHYGGYQLYEGEYEKVFLFDAEVEINALKARIEALEAALQRVPYAGYDKQNGKNTKENPLIIDEVNEISYYLISGRDGSRDAVEIIFKTNCDIATWVKYKGTLFIVAFMESSYLPDTYICTASACGVISKEVLDEAKAVKPQTKDEPITITEITWKDLQATFIDGSCKAGPSFTINTYLHIGFKHSGCLNKGDLVKYQIGVKNADGTGTVLDFLFRVTYVPIISSGQTEYEYSAVSLFTVTDEIKELFGKI